MAVVQQKQRNQATEASDGDGETNDDAKEQQEAAQLQPLTKITAQQAAEADQKAKASEVKLENEDGNLVYTVIIGQQAVAVDAGNVRILYVERLNQENGKPEMVHPRSSIQVSQSHDRDAETNDDG